MPARLEIEGGIPLSDTVSVSAAKNATLPALAAALLTARPVVIENPPGLADVTTLTRLLERLGATVTRQADGSTRVQVERVTSSEAPYDLVSTMRAKKKLIGHWKVLRRRLDSSAARWLSGTAWLECNSATA